MVETNYRHNGITLPKCKQRSIDRYVEDGTDPGHFLSNCLANDLQGAYSHADSWGVELIPVIVKYIYNRIPGCSWGSHEVVKKWRGMDHWYKEKEKREKKLTEDWTPVESIETEDV